jgi:Rrf2 family protein
LRSVSERTGISSKYLEQLAKSMVEAGFLASTRGARGGYALARPASEITSGDILRAAEGSYAPVACLEGDSPLCPLHDDCATVGFWAGLEKAIDAYVDSVTLSNLVAQQRFSELNAGDRFADEIESRIASC